MSRGKRCVAFVLLCLNEGLEFKVRSWIQRESNTYPCWLKTLIKINAKLYYYPFWQCFSRIETIRLIGNAINGLVSIWGSIIMRKVNKPSHINYKPQSHILQHPTSGFHFFLSSSHAFPLHNIKPLATLFLKPS